jgi:hypothetical protein
MTIFGLLFWIGIFGFTLLVASSLVGFKKGLLGNLIAYPVLIISLWFVGWLLSPYSITTSSR